MSKKDVEPAEITTPEAPVEAEPEIAEPEAVAEAPAALNVGDTVKEYVQNGFRYKRVVTETGTVDMRV